MDHQQADENQPTTEQASPSSEAQTSSTSMSPVQDNEGAAAQAIETAPAHKHSLTQTVKHHAKEVFVIIIYLGCWLSVLATMKCLVLMQYGVREFKNAYIMAWITAVAFGKIIVVAQRMPIVNRMRHRPLFWSCIYKAFFFTAITLLGHRVEERMIHATVDPSDVFPLAGVVAHTLSLFAIFFILFAYRDLDVMLGKGTLKNMFFKSRKT